MDARRQRLRHRLDVLPAFPTTAGALHLQPGGAGGLRRPGSSPKLGPTGDHLVYSTFLAAARLDAQHDRQRPSPWTPRARPTSSAGQRELRREPFRRPAARPSRRPTAGGTSPTGSSTSSTRPAPGGLLDATWAARSDDAAYGRGGGRRGRRLRRRAAPSAPNFPTTAGAYQTSLGGGVNTDAFVTKVATRRDDPGLLDLPRRQRQRRRAGRSRWTAGPGVRDRLHQLLELPRRLRRVPDEPGGGGLGMGSQDAFVTGLNAAGSALVLSTLHRRDGVGDGLRHRRGRLGLRRRSPAARPRANFPTYGRCSRPAGAGPDAFVTRLTPTGTLAYSTYLGGSSPTRRRRWPWTRRGAAYVAGYTNSTNLPEHAGRLPGEQRRRLRRLRRKILPPPDRAGDHVHQHATRGLLGDGPHHDRPEPDTQRHGGRQRDGDAGAGRRGRAGQRGGQSVGGTWTYDYTGTTLPEGTYDFAARATGRQRPAERLLLARLPRHRGPDRARR